MRSHRESASASVLTPMQQAPLWQLSFDRTRKEAKKKNQPGLIDRPDFEMGQASKKTTGITVGGLSGKDIRLVQGSMKSRMIVLERETDVLNIMLNVQGS